MMTDQEQWKQDFERARHYREALDEIAGMKIPYVDAYDVANNILTCYALRNTKRRHYAPRRLSRGSEDT